MAQIRTRGLIIKQSDYGDGHRIISIFTEDYGIVKAVCYGARKSKSKAAASSQFLCWADFELYQGAGRDLLTVNSADTLDSFYPVTEDIRKLSLCVYLADITYSMLGGGNADRRVLHMLLNCFYALAYKNEDTEKVRTVYELRLMCAGGYAPLLDNCLSCGSGAVYAFDPQKGGMVCSGCAGKDAVKMDAPLYKALKFITSCDDKKILSFTASDALLKRLAALSERYITAQLDSRFASLDYYKAML